MDYKTIPHIDVDDMVSFPPRLLEWLILSISPEEKIRILPKARYKLYLSDENRTTDRETIRFYKIEIAEKKAMYFQEVSQNGQPSEFHVSVLATFHDLKEDFPL